MDIPSELMSDKSEPNKRETPSKQDSDSNYKLIQNNSEISVPPTPHTISTGGQESAVNPSQEEQYQAPTVYDNIIVEQSEESSSPTQFGSTPKTNKFLKPKNQRSQHRTSSASSPPLEVPAEDSQEEQDELENNQRTRFDINRNRRSETYTSEYSSAINRLNNPASA